MIIFRNIEHYSDEDYIIENDCIICYEYFKDDNIPINLNSQSKFNKKCNCNLWVHESCLQLWHDATNITNCPICRQNMNINLHFIKLIIEVMLKINYNYLVQNILLIIISYNLTYIYYKALDVNNML